MVISLMHFLETADWRLLNFSRTSHFNFHLFSPLPLTRPSKLK